MLVIVPIIFYDYIYNKYILLYARKTKTTKNMSKILKNILQGVPKCHVNIKEDNALAYKHLF